MFSKNSCFQVENIYYYYYYYYIIIHHHYSYFSITSGSETGSNCGSCHAKMSVLIRTVRFIKIRRHIQETTDQQPSVVVKKNPKQRDQNMLGIKVNFPLPKYECYHYYYCCYCHYYYCYCYYYYYYCCYCYYYYCYYYCYYYHYCFLFTIFALVSALVSIIKSPIVGCDFLVVIECSLVMCVMMKITKVCYIYNIYMVVVHFGNN